ncbi:hypothetical protein DFJ73DRAFT_959090 [Zopfochytrium polystomum]|nr:hypothetical protein DFJ73DRAFT_959090 [Zopfochytrium polystomum]
MAPPVPSSSPSHPAPSAPSSSSSSFTPSPSLSASTASSSSAAADAASLAVLARLGDHLVYASNPLIASLALRYELFMRLLTLEFLRTFKASARFLTSQSLGSFSLADIAEKANGHNHTILGATPSSPTSPTSKRSSHTFASRNRSSSLLSKRAPLFLDVPFTPDSPTSLPILSRGFYHRWIRSMPILESRGEAYLRGIDAFVENGWLLLIGSWIRATKFDVMGFAKHHIALFFFAFPNGPEQTPSKSARAPPTSTQAPALGRDEDDSDDDDVFHDAEEGDLDPTSATAAKALEECDAFRRKVIYQLASATSIPSVGRFASHGTRCVSHSLDGDDDEDVYYEALHDPTAAQYAADPYIQARRYEDLVRVWVNTARAAYAVVSEVRSDPNNNDKHAKVYGPALFDVCAKCRDYEDLPANYKELVELAVTGTTVVLDNILDEKGWRHKVQLIWSKLPLSLIVGSLRLINPMSVEKAMEPLVHEVEHGAVGSTPGSQIGSKKLRVLLENGGIKFSGPHQPSKPHHRHHHHHRSHHNHHNHHHQHHASHRTTQESEQTSYDAACMKYARLILRRAEKARFVDVIGSTEVTDFIIHIAAILPPLLTEMWSCTDMANLAKVFFDVCTECLDALAAYDRMSGGGVDDDILNEARHQLAHDEGDDDGDPSGAGAGAAAASRAAQSARREGVLKTRAEILAKTKASIMRLVREEGYRMVYNLANREPVGPHGIHSMVDWFAREFVAWSFGGIDDDVGGDGRTSDAKDPPIGASDAAKASASPLSTPKEEGGLLGRCVLEVSVQDAVESVIRHGLLTQDDGVRWGGVVARGLADCGLDESAWIGAVRGGSGRRQSSGEKCLVPELSGCKHCTGLEPVRKKALTSLEVLDRLKVEMLKQIGPIDVFAKHSALRTVTDDNSLGSLKSGGATRGTGGNSGGGGHPSRHGTHRHGATHMATSPSLLSPTTMSPSASSGGGLPGGGAGGVSGTTKRGAGLSSLLKGFSWGES